MGRRLSSQDGDSSDSLRLRIDLAKRRFDGSWIPELLQLLNS
jgi:hypothetical protein